MGKLLLRRTITGVCIIHRSIFPGFHLSQFWRGVLLPGKGQKNNLGRYGRHNFHPDIPWRPSCTSPCQQAFRLLKKKRRDTASPKRSAMQKSVASQQPSLMAQAFCERLFLRESIDINHRPAHGICTAEKLIFFFRDDLGFPALGEKSVS